MDVLTVRAIVRASRSIGIKHVVGGEVVGNPDFLGAAASKYEPRMLTKPRTVCACQPVTFNYLRQGCSLRAFHHRDDCGFLVGVVRLAGGLLGLPSLQPFFARLAFLLDVRLLLGCGASGAALFSASIVFVITGCSLTGFRSSHSSLQPGETASQIREGYWEGRCR